MTEFDPVNAAHETAEREQEPDMTSPSAAADEPAGGPTPGFTFADKRKIAPDGSPVSPTGGGSTPPAGSAPATEPAGADAATPDANEVLAAERLADLQRLQAEYANYRKRVDRDRATARRRHR